MLYRNDRRKIVEYRRIDSDRSTETWRERDWASDGLSQRLKARSFFLHGFVPVEPNCELTKSNATWKSTTQLSQTTFPLPSLTGICLQISAHARNVFL